MSQQSYTLPYGKASITVKLPSTLKKHCLVPAEVAPAPNPMKLVEQALNHTAVETILRPFAQNKNCTRNVAITINDKTRPVPHHLLLPPLLEKLAQLGFLPESVNLLIATGTHPVMPPAEYPMILPPEIMARYPIICHDCEDDSNLVYLGVTARQTPIWLNRHYYEADLRIVIGNIEPHQFMGFSGGVKSAVIGLAGKQTINHNHAMMGHAGAKLAQFAGNPARQDVEEMGRRVGIHLALNAILNDHKQIVHVLAGSPESVMELGMPEVRKLCQVEVETPFDLMVVSPGGHPKDINLYQTQKGLAHATLVTKPGGTIILLAACPEGTGSQTYEAWMQGVSSYEAVFEKFAQEGFRVGPHKAFQIARDAAKVKVLLYSTMNDDWVRRLLLTPIDDVAATVAEQLSRLPDEAQVGLMPLANITIPVLVNQHES